MSWYKESQKESLLELLNSLKPKMAEAAQEVYDSWDQNEDGEDMTYGCGGICDDISRQIEGVIGQFISGVDTISGGQDGDDHAWIVAKLGDKAFGIDIPAGYYEFGSGYCWKKRPDVIFTPEMIEIFEIDISNMDFEEYL